MEPITRVLLIEDDEEDYLLTRDLLFDSKDSRFDLDWISSYDAAVEAMQQGDRDIYLIDYRLGQRDGLELLKRFAASSFPMIILTGQDDRELDLQAMRLGAMDYLIKGQINAALLERSIRYSIARKRTEEALRRKDEFLAMLSHELRNPLAPMRTALQLLELPDLGTDHARQARNVIHRQLDHLVRLVDDLLDVSRIMQGRIELQKQTVNLATIVRHAIETAQPTIDRHGHQLSVALPPDDVCIDADPVRLSQTISNVLINAAKYTPNAGQIWISAGREENDAVIRVRDCGVGIDPSLLPHIFELFVQGERSLDRSQGGLGIGLTVVRRLIQLHGGTVEAFSAGQGFGSEFLIRIPVSEESLQAADEPSLLPSQAGSRRVLVVDDNVDAAECIGLMLEMKGHRVDVAYDGFAAVELANRNTPDIILLDIGLPGRDGYEVAKILRADSKFAGTKIVAVTGYGQSEDRQRSKQAGMDEHLTKPVDINKFEVLVRTFEPPTPNNTYLSA